MANRCRTAPAAPLACSRPLMRRVIACSSRPLLALAARRRRRPRTRRCIVEAARAARCAPPGAYSGAYVVDLSGDRRAVFRWRSSTAAHPGLEHQAVHHRRRAGPLRQRGHAGHRGARDAAARAEGGLARRPLPARRRRPDLRQPPLRAPGLRRRSHGRGPGRAARGGRHRARDRPGLRRRVALRLAARRPGLGLRHLDLGRPAERPGLQPRAGDESGRGFQTNPPVFAAARLDAALERAASPCGCKPRAGVTPAARRCWPASTRRRWRAWSGSPTSRPTTSSPRCCSRASPTRPAASAPPQRGARLAARFARRLGARARARGRLGPVARQPRLALPRGPAAHARCRGATSSTPSSPRSRSPAATARSTADAPRARPRPLPRQDGHALERERAVGLLRGALRRHLRLLDPDERRVSQARRPADAVAGPDGCQAIAGDRSRA